MVFKLKTTVYLTKEFTVEAESPKDAMNAVQQQLLEGFDLNTLEIDRIGFDVTDPTIREYNRQWGKMISSSLSTPSLPK